MSRAPSRKSPQANPHSRYSAAVAGDASRGHPAANQEAGPEFTLGWILEQTYQLQGDRVALLLSALGVFIVVCALLFLLTRRRHPTIALNGAGSARRGREPAGVPSGPWTRSERIALASLVVGAVLGILGLFAR